jgi:hypothetical protein
VPFRTFRGADLLTALLSGLAADYQNEAEVGDALAEAFETGLAKREELFITTKVIFITF